MLNLEWLQNKKYVIILALMGVVFLLVYTWFLDGDGTKFMSPDETANYHFIKLFAEESQLRFYEPLSEITDGLVGPRSMGFVGGYSVPGSFLGIILIYGILAKIFGTGAILYLTPIISVVSVLFFYLLIKKIFSEKIAFISLLLLFILPPFWYYSARGMFHNVLFISLLIIGFNFLVSSIQKTDHTKKATIQIVLSGVFIGMALITRTSEIVWVILCIVAIIYFSKKVKWQHAIMLFCVIGIMFIPIFFYNNQVFGSPWSFSYTQILMEVSNEGIADNSIIDMAVKLVLPFGVELENVGRAVYQYLVIIFPWFSILLFVGIVWFLKSVIINKLSNILPELKKYSIRLSGPQKMYFGLYSFVVVWLILYYGSYIFYEHYDQSEIILGSSYLRYWLPVFIFGLPILVTAIFKISDIFNSSRVRKFVIVFLVVGISVFSVNKVLADPLQGLLKIKTNVEENVSKSDLIFSKTEPDSIIVSGFADKILFPERRVIVRLPSDKEESNKLVQQILSETSLYYFNNALDDYGKQVMDSLKASGYVFEEVYSFVDDNEVLYELH